MRSLLTSLILTLGLAVSAAAQEATDVPAIRNTIAGQLDAFRADDLPRAFSFASPSIQGMFGTPGNFGLMVQRGYPSIWRPSRVIYFDQRAEGGKVLQRMGFVDAAGAEHWFAYEMVQVDGVWKINAVYPIDAPDPTV